MSNITIPVPSLDDLDKIGYARIYDKNPIRRYYRIKRYALMNNRVGYETSREVRRGSEDKIYLEGFEAWLKNNFVKNPGWLKLAFREDPEYRPIKSSSQGPYIEFDVSELEEQESYSGRQALKISDTDIIYRGGRSLKKEIAAGKDGIKGTLVKTSNGKWRVYLNGYSTPKGSTGNPARTTSTNSKTSTTSNNGYTSSISNTRSTRSTSSTSSISSTAGSSSISSTDSISDTSSTTNPGSSTSTDSTTSTRSFDFLDDVLGTQNETGKDKTTELDPNQIANTIVNETKLNDTAISSLVSTYLNSLQKINRSYNTQTK